MKKLLGLLVVGILFFVGTAFGAEMNIDSKGTVSIRTTAFEAQGGYATLLDGGAIKCAASVAVKNKTTGKVVFGEVAFGDTIVFPNAVLDAIGGVRIADVYQAYVIYVCPQWKDTVQNILVNKFTKSGFGVSYNSYPDGTFSLANGTTPTPAPTPTPTTGMGLSVTKNGGNNYIVTVTNVTGSDLVLNRYCEKVACPTSGNNVAKVFNNGYGMRYTGIRTGSTQTFTVPVVNDVVRFDFVPSINAVNTWVSQDLFALGNGVVRKTSDESTSLAFEDKK